MKLTVLYAVLMVVITANVAYSQNPCYVDTGCDYSCTPCHAQQTTCYGGSPDAYCSECIPCYNLTAEARVKLQAKNAERRRLNPKNLTEAGHAWQTMYASLIHVGVRDAYARGGHPPMPVPRLAECMAKKAAVKRISLSVIMNLGTER